jgi:hypothetical protein
MRGNLEVWWKRSFKTREWFRKAGKRLERDFLEKEGKEGSS